MKIYGVDVSENNGTVDWDGIARAGMKFAVVRLGYGRGHLDGKFYENVNGALDAGLKLGVYLYSYAMSDERAGEEADFAMNTLDDCGVNPELGVWFDMEDADGYKARHGFTDPQEITNACNVFINRLWASGRFNPGVYSNYDWLTRVIDVSQLGGVAVWAAQYNRACDYPDPLIWQFTDRYLIGGRRFDANVMEA